MFSYKDGFFFGRMENGDVRILKLEGKISEFPKVNGAYRESLIDITIDVDGWKSIIVSVSASGETADKWNEAEIFHNNT